VIDYVKVRIDRDNIPDGIREHKKLNFTIPVNPITGEIKERATGLVAFYKSMRFFIHEKSGVLFLSGSLHKYANDGMHNYDIFTYKRLAETLNELHDVFGIDLSRCVLQNLEIGLNIDPTIRASQVVKSLVMHKVSPFKYYAIKGSEYRQAEHDRYIIKAYNKGLQYRGKYGTQNLGEIFRFEIKYIKMQEPNKIGIGTMQDLYDPVKLRVSLELLFDQWHQVTLFDPTIEKALLSDHVKNIKIWHWQNFNWWELLSKSRRYDEKKYMNTVVEKHSQNIKEIILQKMKNQIPFLLGFLVPSHRLCKNDKTVLTHHLNIVCEGNILCTHFPISEMVMENPRIGEQLTA